MLRWESEIIFHNWMADWPITEKMGLNIPYANIVDTMVLIYQLGNLPQGLKAVAYRELGMAMQDFEDVVKPHSEKLILDYYRSAYEYPWERPEPQLVRDPDGNWKLYKPQSIGTKLKRFFSDHTKNPEKDVFKMWTDNWAEHHEEIQLICGEWPGMDIRHAAEADWPTVLRYACRDPDATLRLRILLKKMIVNVRRYSQERWREKVA